MDPEHHPDTIPKTVDRLNNEAWEIRVSDSNRAFALSKEAVALSRQAGYTKGLAEGLRSYGFGLIRLSRHEEALPVLKEAFGLFEALKNNRGRAEVYEYFGIVYRSLGRFDASLENLHKALDLSIAEDYQQEASLAYYHLGVTYKYLGNFEKALEYLLESLRLAREIRFWVSESYALNLIGQVYFETGDYQQALRYYQQSLQIRKASGDLWGEAGCLDNIGYTYAQLGEIESAVDHCTESLAICRRTGDKKGQANTLFHLSALLQQQGAGEQAYAAACESLEIRKEINDKKGQAETLLLLADVPDAADATAGRAAEFLQQALVLGTEIGAKDLLSRIHLRLYRLYKQQGRFQQALQSLEQHNQTEGKLHKDALAEKVVNLQITHRAEQAKKEAENYRLRHNELANLYEALKRQTGETELQKQKAEQALDDLKATQQQLIQREKMAFLGELTAGIAHEIQNPLNFVNNFAEVDAELTGELKEELLSGNIDTAFAIAEQLKDNSSKISYYGKRADAIVKSMLQHSRTSAGAKELINLNALIDEYLRLSYHGMRVKDNSFNAKMETDFDETLSKVEVVPQEIGRVLLNLFNNAFYAVQEKKKRLNGTYEPMIFVGTGKRDGKLEIIVKDNGTGIPEKVVDKIFQPFFTTKPTGEGTGLGLSLSYEIITRGHGGTINMQSRQGEGAVVTIELPF